MKNRLSTYSFLLVFVMLTACGSQKGTTSNRASDNVRTYSIQSVMWQQNAAEYRALCYQAFNIAKLNLDAILNEQPEHPDENKKLAIITDIDETVLDNSPYNAKLIELGEEYTSEGWNDWVQRKSAKAIPGAAEFLNYAREKGVEVFYVSNRERGQEAATIENMRRVKFPYADEKHLLFMGNTSSKQRRFEMVENEYHVVLYMGDNLSDFTSEFRAPSTTKRNELADHLENEFGVKFIVLPNPMYGDWETKGIYHGKYDWTPAQKDSIHKASLRAY